MFRKYLKPSIYLAVLIIPFFIVFFRPKSLSAVPVLDIAAKPVGLVQGLLFEFKKIFYYRDTHDQYIKLKKQNDLLKGQIAKMRVVLQEAKRLEEIEDFRRKTSYPTVIASIIGRDPSNWNASLILNKGAAHGIKPGMPVINTQGVVGKILEVGHSTSKAIMVADPNFSVAAVVARNRESGLLSGTLQGICRLQYLTENADIKVGDQVITSKLSTSFPEGIIIGTVVDVRASVNSHTVECLVEPAVDLSQIDEAVIIKN